MNLRRDRIDVIIDLLELVEKRKNVRFTQIMYGANLGFSSTKAYLKFFVDKGIIEIKSQNPRIYTITEKGKKLLNLLKEVKKTLKIMSISSISAELKEASK